MRTLLRTRAVARIARLLVAAAVLMSWGAPHAWATLATDYQFTVGSSPYTPITGGTTVIAGTNGGVGTFNDAASAGPINIGFAFRFNCQVYTQFGVSPHGVLYLGNQTSNSFNNDLVTAPFYPVIAPFWDHQHLYDNGGAVNGCIFTPPVGVHYVLSGVAPNRVLIVEYNTQVYDAFNSAWWAGCGLTMNRYQLALFEGSNKIEFRYGSMWTSSGQPTAATIGIAAAGANFLSVTPAGATATVSSAVSNNNVALHLNPINANTVYTFTPCAFNLAGSPGLATPAMAPGDTILNGIPVMIGNENSYSPFTISFPGGACPAHSYSMTISGPAATEYRFAATNNQTVAGSLTAGSSISYAMIFRPTTGGTRRAFLTFTDVSSGCSSIYNIAALGTQRISISGNVLQGGTAGMVCGADTLLLGKFARGGSSASWQPLTVTDNETMNLVGPANVTYTITGGGGQYSIAPPSASLTSGQTNTPTITFSPSMGSMGPQPATLTVAADGKSCSFVLYAVAAVPTIEFRIGSTMLDSTSLLFVNGVSCVGEATQSYAIDVRNPGFVQDTVWGTSIYEVDTTFRQGIPSYPLRRDGLGQLIPTRDYVLSTQPPTSPLAKNAKPVYPFQLAPGQTMRLYLTFVGQRPTKRYARIFIRTNTTNIASPDTNGVLTPGLLKMDLFARGIGGRLSDNINGGLPRPINFPVTQLKDSSTMTVTLFNTGECDLRINLPRFEIVSGDVSEFSIVSMPTGTVDPVTGDLILIPGASSTATIRFKPSQVQSRRASIRVQTSDSTIAIPGLTEPGTYYIDLFGAGKQDLYTQGADLGIALIGGDASEHTHGVVRLTNTLNGPVIVTKLKMDGVDATEFAEDPAKAWPKGPKAYVLQGGQTLELGVEFGPAAGGIPGSRDAMIKIYLSTGDSLSAPIHGIAGTRVIEVTPSNLTMGPLSVGKEFRRQVSIRSTGTMPLKITGIDVPPGTDFTIAPLARMDLQPGQQELLEITFAPTTQGAQNAAIDVRNNATNGTQQIHLSATAFKTKHADDPADAITSASGSEELVGNGLEEFSAAGVSGVRNTAGMMLMQSVPNPGRDIVEIGYVMPVRGEATLELFDAQGRLVRVLDAGMRDAGDHSLRIDVSALANGTYHYRLTANGSTLSRMLAVVK